MSELKMIVGLGNPGDEFKNMRHNVGFRVIDSLAEAVSADVKKRKFGARFGQGEFTGKKLILLKPQKFMNCSGQVVATAVGFYKIQLEELLIISDDLALEPGRIRIRAKGSGGGQKGLADIIEKLGTENFARLRIGIGQNQAIPAEDYVLAPPTEEQKPLLGKAIERAKEAVLCWVEFGIEAAMNRFNPSLAGGGENDK